MRLFFFDQRRPPITVHPSGAISAASGLRTSIHGRLTTSRSATFSAAAIAFHRVLGRATLVLATLHVALYLLVWGLEGGLEKVGDEALSACHGSARVSHRPSELFAHACGTQAPSRNISDFYGLLAWCVGVVVGQR